MGLYFLVQGPGRPKFGLGLRHFDGGGGTAVRVFNIRHFEDLTRRNAT